MDMTKKSHIKQLLFLIYFFAKLKKGGLNGLHTFSQWYILKIMVLILGHEKALWPLLFNIYWACYLYLFPNNSLIRICVVKSHMETDLCLLYCRWKMVIHGAIDGFSRATTFLHATETTGQRPFGICFWVEPNALDSRQESAWTMVARIWMSSPSWMNTGEKGEAVRCKAAVTITKGSSVSGSTSGKMWWTLTMTCLLQWEHHRQKVVWGYWTWTIPFTCGPSTMFFCPGWTGPYSGLWNRRTTNPWGQSATELPCSSSSGGCWRDEPAHPQQYRTSGKGEAFNR